ncbi:hypothetical protein H4R35_003649 [Dimargaris xerosporica]|nr:hypothetical protein H4R35_003649 [Dimargaris xerosporica]
MGQSPRSSPPRDIFRNEFHGTDAHTRHRRFMQRHVDPYQRNRPPPLTTGPSELDILRQHHEFLRDAEEDEAALKWEQRVAKNYYDRLYREFCLCDLQRYREGRVAMRWRTESEVLSGKGESSCASLRCTNANALQIWEVMFNYVEQSERKRALVKLTLCPDCSQRLNNRRQHRRVDAPPSPVPEQSSDAMVAQRQGTSPATSALPQPSPTARRSPREETHPTHQRPKLRRHPTARSQSPSPAIGTHGRLARRHR